MTATKTVEDRLVEGFRDLIVKAIQDESTAVSVERVAQFLLLPTETAEDLIARSNWGMDLCTTLIEHFGIEFTVAGPAAVTAVLSEMSGTDDVLPEPAPFPALPAKTNDLQTPVPTPNLLSRTHIRPVAAPQQRIEPGDIDPATGKVFVRMSGHAKDRCAEMDIEWARVFEALQPENIVATRPDSDGRKTLLESCTEPTLLFCVDPENHAFAITVLWKTDVPYLRPMVREAG